MTEPQLIVTKTGEKVVVDRVLTLQYIYNVFFWCEILHLPNEMELIRLQG